MWRKVKNTPHVRLPLPAPRASRSSGDYWSEMVVLISLYTLSWSCSSVEHDNWFIKEYIGRILLLEAPLFFAKIY